MTVSSVAGYGHEKRRLRTIAAVEVSEARNIGRAALRVAVQSRTADSDRCGIAGIVTFAAIILWQGQGEAGRQHEKSKASVKHDCWCI